MKLLTYTLVISLAIGNAAWVPMAFADTNTNTSTSTSTNSNTTAVTNNQTGSQANTQALNLQGAQQSVMLGTMAIGAGSAMVAAGYAGIVPNWGLIGAGVALIAAGVMSLNAAQKMAQNAARAGNNVGNMGGSTTTAVNTVPTQPGSSTLTPTNPGQISLNETEPGGGITIDPQLTRTGRANEIFNDLERQTGMSREDFLNGLNEGKTPGDMLAGAGKLKGGSADGLNNMVKDAMGNGSAPTGSELLSQLGATSSDLGENSYAAGGAGGASRGPASGNANALAGLEGMLGKGDGAGGSSTLVGKGELGVSEDVQNALDRNGLTNLTIFQMVHTQYKKKTPLMFGIPARRASPTAENPFLELGSEKVEL